MASSFDAGHPKSTYYLPNDRNNMKLKFAKEPTSLLQGLQCIYGPILLRLKLQRPITHSITSPKFTNPVNPRETRKSAKEYSMKFE